MLAPKKVKYRKQQKGRMKTPRTAGSSLTFGDFGLRALEPGWLVIGYLNAQGDPVIDVGLEVFTCNTQRLCHEDLRCAG